MVCSLVGCSTSEITATHWSEIENRKFIPSQSYDPNLTIINEGEITPERAVSIAKEVAKKYYPKSIDINSAKILFHNTDQWFVDFTDTARVGRVCPWNEVVGINKRTGEAVIEGSLD